jgi:hypothetical protein
MIESLAAQDVELRATGTGLRVEAAKHEPLDTAQDCGTKAHDTGFKGDVQDGPSEVPSAHFLGCLAQRQHLRVGCRIPQRLPLVATPADDHVIHDDNRPDRHVRGMQRFARLAQRRLHEVLVIDLHVGGTS